MTTIKCKCPKCIQNDNGHWCFGNAAVESKGDPPIRRVVKGTGHLGKIDPIHGLLDALYCFDWSEGRIEQ